MADETPAEKAYKEIEEILKKYDLVIEYKLTFPDTAGIPTELQLAMLILEKYKTKISFIIAPKK